MSCADCFPGATVAIQGGDNVTVDGIGTATNPYEVSVTSVPDGDFSNSATETASPDLDLTGYSLPTTIRVTKETGGGDVLLPSWPSTASGSLTIVITTVGIGGLDFPGLLVPGGDGTGYTLTTTAGTMDMVKVMWTGAEWVLTDELLDIA